VIRRSRRIGLLWSALAALAVSASAGWAKGPAGPVGSLKPNRDPVLPRGSGPMPDSVLAIVDGDRRVTVTGFRHAWDRVEPPSRPDSLTPKTAREFLDLLIGKEALGARALREKFVMTPAESAQLAGLRDRLCMRAALDSALHEVQGRMLASGDTVTNAQALGVAARESLVTRMDVSWNEPLVKRLASAFAALPKPSRDSSLMAQLRALGALPQVDSTELHGPLAHSRTGAFTVQDLLDSWSRLNPIERPRVETTDQVKDLVKNGLFERELRARAERARLAERPDIAAALANQREYFAVEHLVAREVYAKIDTSRAAYERFYRETESYWALPMRVDLTRLLLSDRASANTLAVRLANPADAESLVARAERRGVRYRYEVSEDADSVLYRGAMRAGIGGIVGPDSVDGAWRVARVNVVLPPRNRSFEEVRDLVGHRRYGEEGERLMVELMDRVTRATSVAVNERALQNIKPW
jgi:hypothetical protein